MRATSHRCGEARARQSDFPSRNHSIPHHPFPFLYPLSVSLSPFYFRLTTLFFQFGSLFLFRLSAFLPRTPFHPLHPFLLLSHLDLSVSCAYTHIDTHTYTFSLSSLSPFHLIRSSTASERAQNGSSRVYPHVLTRSLITRASRLRFMFENIYEKIFVFVGRVVDEEVRVAPEENRRIVRPNPRGTFID